MSTIDTKESDPFKALCEVYILFFDESKGHVPLVMFPDDSIKNDAEQMRPINIHSIWFLDVKEQEALDHVDLEYGNKIYFAKKFQALSKRKKRRAGLEEETPEVIVIMLSLPTEMDIFGGDLINKITEIMKKKFAGILYNVIESEIAKDEIIKTPQVKEKITKGNAIKDEIKLTLQNIVKEYFSSVIKQSDATSIKKQKAISFLMLKGLDISHITSENGSTTFSDIKLFDPNKKTQNGFNLKLPFQIVSVNVIQDSQELEILVRNNKDHEMNDITIKISHVKEFFEKEIMEQKIDSWYPGEELLFSINIIPHINEYLFFIVDEDYEGIHKRLLSKKIDVNTLHKIKS